MTAMVVMTLLTDPTPYCVVAEGFLPAGVIRPNVWLHTGSPSTTKATDAEVESVCLSAFRTALRPSLIVVLNDGAGASWLPRTRPGPRGSLPAPSHSPLRPSRPG